MRLLLIGSMFTAVAIQSALASATIGIQRWDVEDQNDVLARGASAILTTDIASRSGPYAQFKACQIDIVEVNHAAEIARERQLCQSGLADKASCGRLADPAFKFPEPDYLLRGKSAGKMPNTSWAVQLVERKSGRAVYSAAYTPPNQTNAQVDALAFVSKIGTDLLSKTCKDALVNADDDGLMRQINSVTLNPFEICDPERPFTLKATDEFWHPGLEIDVVFTPKQGSKAAALVMDTGYAPNKTKFGRNAFHRTWQTASYNFEILPEPEEGGGMPDMPNAMLNIVGLTRCQITCNPSQGGMACGTGNVLVAAEDYMAVCRKGPVSLPPNPNSSAGTIFLKRKKGACFRP